MKRRVRAIIIQNKSLLLMHRVKNSGEYWVFPGGGLEESDSSPQEGLKRECKEELGVDVYVENLFTEEELDSPNGKQIESFYSCRIVGGEVGTGQGPEFSRDPNQAGTYEPQWVALTALSAINVLPVEVRDKIVASSW